MTERIVVGMSGGVDSFVTALWLKKKGFDVIGVHLQLLGNNELEGVQHVCRQVGIPLFVRDGKELFRHEVVEYFVDEYKRGKTPSPCCVCNCHVKWKLLDQVANEVDARYVATGHYVRIVRWQGKYYVAKGVDVYKDQSYFLWGLPSSLLERALTPLGDYTKEEVKAWAIEQGYEEVARKRESMSVCFLRGDDYRDFLGSYGCIGTKSGDIVDENGDIVGRHTGLEAYTIGQKKGLPQRDFQSLYVSRIDVEKNILEVSSKEALWTNVLFAEKLVYSCGADLKADDVTVKIRGVGQNPEGTVKIELLENNSCRVVLTDPAWAAAPGQPLVFYRKERVVGGGFLMMPLNRKSGKK